MDKTLLRGAAGEGNGDEELTHARAWEQGAAWLELVTPGAQEVPGRAPGEEHGGEDLEGTGEWPGLERQVLKQQQLCRVTGACEHCDVGMCTS